MGDCAELSVTPNGCCFPATETCEGQQRPGDTKYSVEQCHPSEVGPCSVIEENVGKQDFSSAQFEGDCVQLENGVSRIGEGGFEYAHMDSIVIPSTVLSIGKQSFKSINEGQSGLVVIWSCDANSGTWPRLDNGIQFGQDWDEYTTITHKYSCVLSGNPSFQQNKMMTWWNALIGDIRSFFSSQGVLSNRVMANATATRGSSSEERESFSC